MYIKEISIEGFRNFPEIVNIEFNKGLNVLLGENGAGKSAIIDAIRLLFSEDEYGRAGIQAHDFYKPFDDKTKLTDFIQIIAHLSMESQQEKIAFLPWMIDNDQSQVTLRIDNKEIYQNRYRRVLWGGVSKDSMFEHELFDSINSIYLPPLRDAEAKLRSGRNSRLARLLLNLNLSDLEKAHENNQKHPLEDKVKKFNDEIASDKDLAIYKTNELIQNRLKEALGVSFGQDTNIQFSEVDFNRIVEGLQLFFYPSFNGSVDKELYRSLEENSLGYNNILYLATVLAELAEGYSQENEYLRILLIEEPEAHLHPQLQIRLLKYLEEQAHNNNVQIIVTTHSPVLTSSVSLNSLIHLSWQSEKIKPTLIKKCGLKTESQDFLKRWLDVTKSTLFFAKGILFVEGIAEAILLEELANRVLVKYNHETGEKNPTSLSDAGISIINMGGIYFNHFMQLFCNLSENNNIDSVPIRCAGITDNDPPATSKPTFKKPIEGMNICKDIIGTINKSKNCRLFISPLKTFEYDLAMHGENLRVMLSPNKFRPDDEDVKNGITQFAKEKWSKELTGNEELKAKVSSYLLKSIKDKKGEYSQILADKLKKEPDLYFVIPDYIKDAILWVIRGIDAKTE